MYKRKSKRLFAEKRKFKEIQSLTIARILFLVAESP